MTTGLVYYFRTTKIDPYIVITYQEKDEDRRVVLEGIRFILEESEVKNFISSNQLMINESKTILKIRSLIEDYLSGNKIELFNSIKDLKVDLALSDKFPTEFMQKVVQIVSHLKHGETISYSGIGEKINSKAFRAIGSIMAKNPLPLIIPCHRVIKKSGEIGGFMGKTDQEWQKSLKQSLIKLEM